MKRIFTLLLALLTSLASVCGGKELREVIVSHTDDSGVLQLYRMKEDGSDSKQLTHSKKGCRMPGVSPDGKKLLYAEQVDHGMSIRLSDITGKNARALVGEGMNLLPSWLPDSRHIVWMKTQGVRKGQDPASASQIHIMNTETGESRRLFSDPEQIKFSNSMPSVSPNGQRIAFVSNRSGSFRIWVSNLDGSDAIDSSQFRRDGFSQLARRLTGLLSQDQRDIGGIVAVVAAARALNSDSGQLGNGKYAVATQLLQCGRNRRC